MNRLRLIVIASLLLFGLMSYEQTKVFHISNTDIYTYVGSADSGWWHFLTFQSDSEFHITVPNGNTSCFSYGEYGGHLETKGDTLIFRFHRFNQDSGKMSLDQNSEMFKAINDTSIVRLSSERFMCKSYTLNVINENTLQKRKRPRK